MCTRSFSASTWCVQNLLFGSLTPSLECSSSAAALPECLASRLLTFIHFFKHIWRISGLLMFRFFLAQHIAHNAIFCVIYSIFIPIFSSGIVATLLSLERSWKCQTSSRGFSVLFFFLVSMFLRGEKNSLTAKTFFLNRPEHATLLLFDERANSFDAWWLICCHLYHFVTWNIFSPTEYLFPCNVERLQTWLMSLNQVEPCGFQWVCPLNFSLFFFFFLIHRCSTRVASGKKESL